MLPNFYEGFEREKHLGQTTTLCQVDCLAYADLMQSLFTTIYLYLNGVMSQGLHLKN